MNPARRVNTALLLQLIIPVLWFGMVCAISFIEAPLKFTAPGITIPLGLGIGRLVFAALNMVEAALLVALMIASFWPRSSRIAGARLAWFVTIFVVLIFKVAVVRPPLNARTDLVLSGADPGQSPWHYIYIAADCVLVIALIVFAALSARTILRISRIHGQPVPERHPLA